MTSVTRGVAIIPEWAVSYIARGVGLGEMMRILYSVVKSMTSSDPNAPSVRSMTSFAPVEAADAVDTMLASCALTEGGDILAFLCDFLLMPDADEVLNEDAEADDEARVEAEAEVEAEDAEADEVEDAEADEVEPRVDEADVARSSTSNSDSSSELAVNSVSSSESTENSASDEDGDDARLRLPFDLDDADFEPSRRALSFWPLLVILWHARRHVSDTTTGPGKVRHT
jgi:hypothetical protein